MIKVGKHILKDAGVLLIVAVMVSSTMVVVGNVKETSNDSATFIADFMTPEGDRYPCNVIISDGEWIQEWFDVTHIETDVPETATYSYDYSRAEYQHKHMFPLTISTGESKEFDFYALDIGEMLDNARVKPYIMCHEKGANIDLTWDWDPDTLTLSYNTGAPGKLVGVTTFVDVNMCATPNYAVDNDDGGPNCDIGPTNGGIAYTIESISDAGYAPIVFKEIDTSFGAIHPFDYWNYGVSLKNLEGQEYLPQYNIPQYAVPSNHYIFTIEEVSEEYTSLDLPVKVNTGKGTILEIYHPKISELESNTFFIAAEVPFSDSSYSNLQHNPDTKTISVVVNTESNNDWWGCFFLQGHGRAVEMLTAYDNVESRDLDMWYNYTINQVDEYNMVVVRIEPDVIRLKLEYIEDNPPAEPTIDGPTSGKPGTSYTYTISNIGIEDVYFFIDWGDDTYTWWFGPYTSGETATAKHTWTEEGTYTIKAKAKDTNGLESDWGMLEVTMPKNKPYFNAPFLQFLENHPRLFPLLRQLLGV